MGHLRRVFPGRVSSGPGRLHYGRATETVDDSDQEEATTEEDLHHLCVNDYGPVSVGTHCSGQTYYKHGGRYGNRGVVHKH